MDDVQAFKELVRVATRLNSTLNIQELLQLIIVTLRNLVGAEEGSLLLLDPETGELTFHVSSEQSGELIEQRIPAGRGIAGWVLEHGQSLAIDDAARDPRFYGRVDASMGKTTRSLLAVPLLLKDDVIGVVEAINKQGEATFTASDVERAEALASLAAVAVDNSRMYAKLTDAVVEARLSYRL
jgi:sigma-B regulation protein RsbU (phosphoserine phosphatase)